MTPLSFLELGVFWFHMESRPDTACYNARMRMPHSSARQGKKVKVRLKSGQEFVAKFLERKGDRLRFYDHGDVSRGELLRFTIYKPRS